MKTTKEFLITNPYSKLDEVEEFLSIDYFGQRLKHEQTCIKNRRKRKKRK